MEINTYECENCSRKYKTHKRYQTHLERCNKRLKNGYTEEGYASSRSSRSVTTLGSLKRSHRKDPRDNDSVAELDSRFSTLNKEKRKSSRHDFMNDTSETVDRVTRDRNRLKRELTEC